jgi:hypothetical protein
MARIPRVWIGPAKRSVWVASRVLAGSSVQIQFSTQALPGVVGVLRCLFFSAMPGSPSRCRLSHLPCCSSASGGWTLPPRVAAVQDEARSKPKSNRPGPAGRLQHCIGSPSIWRLTSERSPVLWGPYLVTLFCNPVGDFEGFQIPIGPRLIRLQPPNSVEDVQIGADEGKWRKRAGSNYEVFARPPAGIVTATCSRPRIGGLAGEVRRGNRGAVLWTPERYGLATRRSRSKHSSRSSLRK